MLDGRDFVEETRIVLDEGEDIKVNLDLSVRTEAMKMGSDGVATVTAKAGEGRPIEEPYLSMLDWTAVHLDLLDDYKEAKGLHNLLIAPEAPRRIMEKKDPAAYNLIADDALFEPRNFAGLSELQEAVQTILHKYVDRFYAVGRQRWDSENMVLRKLTGEHPNFADYTVKIKRSEEELVESEEKFVSALRTYCAGRNDGPPPGTKLFLLRNLTRSKGVGFFGTNGFYPDFILWAKDANGAQKVVFVEPHGMRNDDPPPNNGKVDLYLTLRDLSDRIEERDGPKGVFLDSYIVSATPFHELSKKWREGWTRERFARRHVLFEDDLGDRISALLQPRDELERRIFTSYPSPLAYGFESLTRIVDPRDLYREQLRVAENMLAFLASVSLALLREEDRRKADLDLVKYWKGGISPGDWRDIAGRCSKVFAGYKDVPLAAAIHKLNIGSEKKSFGRDVIGLIRAKNDYKHDRGPSDLQDTMKASDEAQEMLRRCMEALAFFADYPIRWVEGSGTDYNSESRGEGLSLDLGGGNRVPLYPFIVPMTCSNLDYSRE